MSYIYMEHLFLMFLHHTRRRTTVGRTPLDEWSARRWDLYLTTHDTHNRQTSIPPGGIRTHDLSRRAAADLRFRPRGHWDRRYTLHTFNNSEHSYCMYYSFRPHFTCQAVSKNTSGTATRFCWTLSLQPNMTALFLLAHSREISPLSFARSSVTSIAYHDISTFFVMS